MIWQNFPQVNSVNAGLILRPFYETRYGIHDHVSPNREKHPFEAFLYRPTEDFTTNTALYDRLETFALKRIYEVWGLSVTEFFRLPRFITAMIEEITDRRNEKMEKALNNAQSNLESMTKRTI